ncbi:MAG: DUF4914 family protein, partial [Candidatus Omnitrophica bacterium]|nr:DUF4914 family protein [Candidatus Omnitrophota bacterium]
MDVKTILSWQDMNLPEELRTMLAAAKSVHVPKDREELIELAMGGDGADTYEVNYDIDGKKTVHEVIVHRCRNGVSVNYTESYMRRRDPDCMLISDELPSDKPRYDTRYKKPFPDLKAEILVWMQNQDLLVLPFYAGSSALNCGALLVGPANAAFFAAALAEIQGMIKEDEIKPGF